MRVPSAWATGLLPSQAVPPRFTFSSEVHGSALVVALQGKMDLYAAQIGRKGLRDVVLAHPGEVVIDLRPLTFLDSSGLSVLIALDQDVRAAGRRIRFVRGTSASRVIEVAGMDKQLTWVDDVPS